MDNSPDTTPLAEPIIALRFPDLSSLNSFYGRLKDVGVGNEFKEVVNHSRRRNSRGEIMILASGECPVADSARDRDADDTAVDRSASATLRVIYTDDEWEEIRQRYPIVVRGSDDLDTLPEFDEPTMDAIRRILVGQEKHPEPTSDQRSTDDDASASEPDDGNYDRAHEANSDPDPPPRPSAAGSLAGFRRIDPFAGAEGAGSHHYLVEHIAYAGHLTVMAAWMGVGKTKFVMALAAALILQLRAFGLLNVAPLNGRILYVSELSSAEISATVNAMCETYGITREQFQQHVDVLAMDGESILNRRVAESFLGEALGYSLVVIDTLDRWSGVDPNLTDDILKAMGFLRRLTDAGSSVLCLDHQSKATKGQSQRQSAVSGASAKQRDASLVFRLDRRDDDDDASPRILKAVKDRFGLSRNLTLTIEDGKLVGSYLGSGGLESLKIEAAKRFIIDELTTTGELSRKVLLPRAQQAGFTDATFNRAIRSLKDDGRIPEEGSVYVLTDKDPTPPQE